MKLIPFVSLIVIMSLDVIAGMGITITCTNCQYAVKDSGKTEIAVGSGKMPGHNFGVVYCRDCKEFACIDLVSKKELQDLVADYEKRLATTDLSKDERNRYTFLRDSLKPELGRRPENPLACQKCSKNREVVEVKHAEFSKNKDSTAVIFPCPKCAHKSMIMKRTGLCWD
ncbi:MAG: hypothetical protein WCI20_00500 [bacterium]